MDCISIFLRKTHLSSTFSILLQKKDFRYNLHLHTVCGHTFFSVYISFHFYLHRLSSLRNQSNVCVCLVEHGGPRRGGWGPWGRDEGRMWKIWQSGQVCHFWGESGGYRGVKWMRCSDMMLTDCMSSQIAEVPDDEAVRIFLEFERVESAIKGQ